MFNRKHDTLMAEMMKEFNDALTKQSMEIHDLRKRISLLLLADKKRIVMREDDPGEAYTNIKDYVLQEASPIEKDNKGWVGDYNWEDAFSIGFKKGI